MHRLLQEPETAAVAECPVEISDFLFSVGPVLLLAVLAAGLLSNNEEPLERRINTLGTACLAFFVYWFVSAEIVDQTEFDSPDTEWLDLFRPITNSSGLAPYLKEPQNPNFFESILNTCIEYAYVVDGVVGLAFLASTASTRVEDVLATSNVWKIVSVVVALVHLPGVFAGDIIFGVLVIIAVLASDLIHGLFGNIGKMVDGLIQNIPRLDTASTSDEATHSLLQFVLMLGGSVGNVATDPNGAVPNVFSPTVLAAAANYVAHNIKDGENPGDRTSQLTAALQIIPFLVQAYFISDGLCTEEDATCQLCEDRYQTIVNQLGSMPWPAWVQGAGVVFGAAATAQSVTNVVGGVQAQISDIDAINAASRDAGDAGDDEECAPRGDGRVVGADGIRLTLCSGATGASSVKLKLPQVTNAVP